MAERNSGGRRRRGGRYLPEELQENIMLRLPVESLTRFESVSKGWRSMVHSRGFIDSYGGRGCTHPDDVPLDVHTTSNADLCRMVPGLIEPLCEPGWGRVFFVTGPLNGLYCVAGFLSEASSKRFSLLTGHIALCNPATRDYRFTRPFPLHFRPRLSEISSKPCLLRFGFGSVIDKKKTKSSSSALDYRVVVIIHYGGAFLVIVYSVQRGSWKVIVDYEPGKREYGERKATEAFSVQGRKITHIYNPLEGCPQRLLKGCSHWMAICEDGTCKVLSFSFADQSFKLIGAPPGYPTYIAAQGERMQLLCDVFVLRDHLVGIQLFSVLSVPSSSNGAGLRTTVEVGLWMMMEYGVEESWSRIYTIYPNLQDEIYKLYGVHYQPLTSGGVRIERLFVRTLAKQIISCDETGCQVIHVDDPEFGVCWNTPGISTFTQTLERPSLIISTSYSLAS